jgi:hypothetical protein
MRKVAFVMAMLLVTLSVPTVTYSKQQIPLHVDFYANDIARVTSEPPGIDCTKEPCSAKFDADSTVTLTAKPLTGPETGNHFVGWEVIYTDHFQRVTSNPLTLSLNLSDRILRSVNAVFKIERCFGAVGSGCGLLVDDSFNSGSKTYPQYGPDTNSDIVVGSILHDGCCLEHPTGYKCGFGDTNPELCQKEYEKADKEWWGGRKWKPSKPFGPYAANMGDPLDILSSPPSSLPDEMKAPDGTKLSVEDFKYCRSESFEDWDEAFAKGVGVCGPTCVNCRKILEKYGIQRDAKGECIMPELISTESYACCYDRDSIKDKECAEEENKGSSK